MSRDAVATDGAGTDYCSDCGERIDADVAVCPNCGAELGADAGTDSALSAQQAELATSSAMGYGFIVLLRFSGVAALLRGPDPLFGGALGAAGRFAFYDGFLLALAGALAAGYVAARWHLDAPGGPTADRVASLALPAVSLLYALGLAAAVLG